LSLAPRRLGYFAGWFPNWLTRWRFSRAGVDGEGRECAGESGQNFRDDAHACAVLPEGQLVRASVGGGRRVGEGAHVPRFHAHARVDDAR
jgi:hypothetical protein